MTTEATAAPAMTQAERVAAYRAHPGINATTIKAGRTSMLHARHAYTRGESKPTANMEFGSAVHAIIAAYPATDAVLPYDGIRKGAAWELFAATNADKIILPRSAFEDVNEAATSGIRLLAELLVDGEYEQPIFWTDEHGISCKALPDFIGRGIIVDFKTTGSIDPRKIERASYDSGWHLQMGWYSLAYAAANPEWPSPDVYILAIESKPPFDAVLYRMDDDAVDAGKKEAAKIARAFAAALESGEYPGIANGETLSLALPTWVEPDAVDMTGMEGE